MKSNSTPIPPKNELEIAYKKYNNLKNLSKIFNVSISTISRWLKFYNIKTNFLQSSDTLEEIIRELNFISLKEIEIKYNIPLIPLKKRILRRTEIPNITYSLDRLKSIISLYDINNQGFIKQVIYDDPNVYESILYHTANHQLYGNKITEKIYRIINNVPEDIKFFCSNCGSPLKFYTIEKGYGYSEKQICHACIPMVAGISIASQKLFDKIYENLNDKENCFYQGLNHEKKFIIENDVRKSINDNNLNKNYYLADFTYKNKVIEFDGVKWHKNPAKEKAKDKFFNSIGYEILHVVDKNFYKDPDKVLNECMHFLSK